MGGQSREQESREGAGDERSHFALAAPPLAIPTASADAAELAPGGDAFRPPGVPGGRAPRAAFRLAGPNRFGRPHLAQAAAKALATEWERGTAFLFVPVFLSAGVLVYFSLAGEPRFLPLISGTLALATALYTARNRFVPKLCLAAALLFVLGMLAGKLETWRAGTKMLGAEISTRITGRVAEVEHLASNRVRLTINLLSTERPRLRYAPDRVRVTARSAPAGLAPGDGVTGAVRLLPPSGPVRPSSYDFSFRSYFDGNGASGFFLTDPQEIPLSVPPTPGERLATAIAGLRAALADHVRERIGGPNGEIAAALIAGVEAGIPDDINEGLRITGLAHVLSISGLHMALVAGVVMTFIRMLLALFPGFASRHPARKYAAGAALFAIAFYLLISGAGVATERSFLMLAIMLLAVLFDRAAITMRNFALAAIAVIVVQPHEVTGPSFQMSFAATAALIGAYGAFAEWRRRRAPRKAPAGRSLLGNLASRAGSHVAGLAMTSLIAGSATALFAAWHFQRVSPLGLIANLATMPVISAVVMPFMVMAMVMMPFGLDGPFLDVMGWGIGVFTSTAMALSRHSPFDAIGIIPGATVALLTIALTILTLATTWLRAAALPFIIAGLFFLPWRPRPDVLVSEDGKLVGLRLSDGRLTVNRDRPNGFAVENWSRALMARAVVKPGRDRSSAMPRADAEVPFACTDVLCIAWNKAGAVVAWAVSETAAGEACAIADLIVIDDATARDPCGGAGPAIITARDLARRGAATVTFATVGGATVTHIDYAVAEPYRPWHAERAFSRAARGKAPYVRKHRKKSPWVK